MAHDDRVYGWRIIYGMPLLAIQWRASRGGHRGIQASERLLSSDRCLLPTAWSCEEKRQSSNANRCKRGRNSGRRRRRRRRRKWRYCQMSPNQLANEKEKLVRFEVRTMILIYDIRIYLNEIISSRRGTATLLQGMGNQFRFVVSQASQLFITAPPPPTTQLMISPPNNRILDRIQSANESQANW